MLTLEALLKTERHMRSFGLGKHHFGQGNEEVPKGESTAPAKKK